MEQKNEKNPKFEFKNIPKNGTIEIELDCSTPIKEGTTDFGSWYLWIGSVKNALVTEGKGIKATDIPNYTGKVIFFPTEKTNKELISLANGKNIKINVKKEMKESSNGKMFANYIITKTGESAKAGSSTSSLLPIEKKLIGDADTLRQTGIKISENDFVSAIEDAEYVDKITPERAKELYKLFIK